MGGPVGTSLVGRRVVLGVSGGIAAYKAIEVCRRLCDAGAFVSPVLTEDATRFVTALTFSALASEPARTGLFDSPEPSPHTTLGQRADLVLVAPCTARVLAKLAAGMSDDLLTGILLATRAPVLICPAMHTEMWEHPAVRDNVALVRRRGTHVLEPDSGRLAGGDIGMGRLPDPARIVEAAADILATPPRNLGRFKRNSLESAQVSSALGGVEGALAGRKVLVTAGGTREAIDPVRFIGNRSSGKQGHAIADEAAARGATVVLVTTVPGRAAAAAVEVVAVESAADMETAVNAVAPGCDVIVMAAAVADFRPKRVADRKLKKGDGVPEIVLEQTPDILAGLGRAKRPGQILVGFAAETHDLRTSALAKLVQKGLDLIVANDVSAPGVGFEHDTNEVVILDAEGGERHIPLTGKHEVAAAVLDAVAARLPTCPPA